MAAIFRNIAPAEGISVVDALRELGFAASNKEARRKLEEGAVKVDGEVIRDPQHLIQPAAEAIALSLGSKNMASSRDNGQNAFTSSSAIKLDRHDQTNKVHENAQD